MPRAARLPGMPLHRQKWLPAARARVPPCGHEHAGLQRRLPSALLRDDRAGPRRGRLPAAARPAAGQLPCAAADAPLGLYPIAHLVQNSYTAGPGPRRCPAPPHGGWRGRPHQPPDPAAWRAGELRHRPGGSSTAPAATNAGTAPCLCGTRTCATVTSTNRTPATSPPARARPARRDQGHRRPPRPAPLTRPGTRQILLAAAPLAGLTAIKVGAVWRAASGFAHGRYWPNLRASQPRAALLTDNAIHTLALVRLTDEMGSFGVMECRSDGYRLTRPRMASTARPSSTGSASRDAISV